MPEPPTRLEAAYKRYETTSGDLESVIRVSAGVGGPEQLAAVQAAHQASAVNLVLESFYAWQGHSDVVRTELLHRPQPLQRAVHTLDAPFLPSHAFERFFWHAHLLNASAGT